MTILLPYPPSHICLRGFWLAISLSGGVLAVIFSSLLLAYRPFAIGAVLAVAIAVPGLLLPQAVSFFYRVWNKLAREFARCASAVLMSICFYVIFVAVGRVGSSLRLTRPTTAQSQWVPRGTLVPSAYISQYATGRGSSQKGRTRTFLSWAAHSGNWWTCCLLPFLLLLSAFETEGEGNSPADIYTLY